MGEFSVVGVIYLGEHHVEALVFGESGWTAISVHVKHETAQRERLPKEGSYRIPNMVKTTRIGRHERRDVC